MICPNCGTQNRDDAKFCKACGTPLRPLGASPAGALPTQPGKPAVETLPGKVVGLEAVFLSGLRKGESVKILTFPATIGRDPNSTLPLALYDQLASTRHAQILYDGETYLLRDVGSSNGTYHNGQRVTEVRLQDADVIEFGVGGPKVRFNFIRCTEDKLTAGDTASRPEAATLQPVPVPISSADVTFSSHPTLSGGTPLAVAGPEKVPMPPQAQGPALPPPPPSPPPPLPFEPVVAQASQDKPLHAATPPYAPAGAPQAGALPSGAPPPPELSRQKPSNLVLIVVISAGVLFIVLVVAAVLVYVFR